jgi:U3 small nucleolar RNA-associated protein 10
MQHETGPSYATFARNLYTWANSESLSPILARRLLQSLFTQIGEEGLVFLASIWTSASPVSLRVAALRHGLAFIGAHEASVDFQLIIPSLLIALSDESKDIRQAGLDIVRKIVPSKGEVGGEVYARYILRSQFE